jgi:hypothetical protein
MIFWKELIVDAECRGGSQATTTASGTIKELKQEFRERRKLRPVLCLN